MQGGANISGATTATLTLSSVTTANAGSYNVRVSNSGGSVTSAAATLTVNAVAGAPDHHDSAGPPGYGDRQRRCSRL